jgi:hypothetical protein
MSLPPHPWHQFWTRTLDAATGVAGSAESLPSLTTQWWTQSMQASQQWWRWWFAAVMPPAGWGVQDKVGEVPPPAADPARREVPRRDEARAGPSEDAPLRRPKAAARHARKG